jgi:hypothetical protein
VLLLMMRCMLLALLAALLAAPVWQRYASAQMAKGWLLIPKESFKETYQKYKPTVDSLRNAGYEFHYFNRGFATQDLRTITADNSLKDTITTANYWSLVKQLETVVGNVPVYLFTQNGIGHFRGSKPNVKFKALHWQTYTAKDSVDKWIAAAAFTNNNNIKVTDGLSSPHGTTYTTSILKNGSDAVHSVLIRNGRTSVNLKNSDEAAVTVDTTILQIAIYTDQYPLDATYLKASLSAAAAFNGTKTILKRYNSSAIIPKGQTWLFWLSEQPVKAELLKSSKNVFRYAPGKVVDVNSWIDPGHIALTKIINPAGDNEAIWKTGFGKPVLAANGHVYNFYSRFNPLWNDLVWNDDFPKLILKLILNETQSQPKGHDRRILSDRQLQPEVFAQSMPKSLPGVNQQADLSKYFWLLLVGLFIAERILSHKKNTTNG